MIAAASLTLLGLAVAYFGLPYLFVKCLHIGVVYAGLANAGEVALTFDDGPDPLTTPRVLDCLRRHGVRASFFVTGEAARTHPDLVLRLRDEGHEVLSHCYHHRHAFLRWPGETYRDTLRGVAVVADLIGSRPRFVRPPHGAYTWSVVWACRRAQVQPVHWTVEAHDWHPDYTPERVVDKVLREVAAGAIILMHDGGPGGPRTALALDRVLHGLRRHGHFPMRLSDLPGLRKGGLRPTLSWFFKTIGGKHS